MSMIESESPADAWRRTLHDGNYTPSADVTPEKLADAFGAEQIDAIYNEAFMAAYQRGSDTVAWRDFETAADDLDARDDQPAEEPHDKAAADSSPEIQSAEATVSFSEGNNDRDGDPNESEFVSEADEDDAAADSEDGADDGEDEQADEDVDETALQPATPDPSEMARDDLEAELTELRERVDDLEILREEFDEIKRVLYGDVACLKGSWRNLFAIADDGNEDATVQSFPERATELRAAITRHGDQLQSFDDLVSDPASGVDKVLQIRRHLVTEATHQANRKFGMSAKHICSFFQGEISHSRGCHLVREAAGDADGKTAPDGFYVTEHGNTQQPMQVKVDLDAMDDGDVYRLNNVTTEDRG